MMVLAVGEMEAGGAGLGVDMEIQVTSALRSYFDQQKARVAPPSLGWWNSSSETERWHTRRSHRVCYIARLLFTFLRTKNVGLFMYFLKKFTTYV